jgi:hypothetical protein
MRRGLVVLTLLLGGCGVREDDPTWPRRFGLGDPAKARQRVELPAASRFQGKTLRGLLESEETIHLDVSLHFLLELREDGGFTYWGQPWLGGDEARIDGRWHRAAERYVLTAASGWPRPSGAVASLECPIQDRGVVEIPLGVDPNVDVFYGLRDLRYGPFPHPSIRSAKRP